MTYIIESPDPTIFIHIPKNAGNSILSMLSSKYYCFHIPNKRTVYTNFHSKLVDVEEFIPKVNKSTFTFTVVRNPWDRTVSWFLYRKGILREGLKSLYANKTSKKVIANKELVEKEYNTMVEDGLYKWLCEYFDKPWDHTWFSLHTLQSDWLKSDQLSVDKIIKLENFEEEIYTIPILCDCEVLHKNKNREKAESSSFKNTDLLDFDTIKFICKFAEEDIDNFKYSIKDLD